MKLYIPGPQGPEQLATKWLLLQRGYRCSCATDIASPDYRSNAGMAPTQAQFRQMQLVAMLEADAVVITDEMTPAQTVEVLHVCRYAGVAAVLHDELPAQCPGAMRDEEILASIALRNEPAPPVKARLRAQFRAASRRAERWARGFDAAWGWFFTNGMKERNYPASKTYPVHQHAHAK